MFASTAAPGLYPFVTIDGSNYGDGSFIRLIDINSVVD